MEPLPATFYGAVDQKNPVISTFENEIKQLLGFMRKLQRASPGDGRHEEHRRGFSTLFNIWVKYKLRLPAWYYQEKLLKVGDSLVQIREYKLALFQCYGRYLEQFCSEDIDDITDVQTFKSTFFPSGTDDRKAGLTFHALQGRCICIYQLVRTSDANLQSQDSVKKCLSILSFLQLIMQVVLPQENLCWLIFNGTLHIYTICRHLMVLGHSSQALEFLLWASVCMESSIPLLSVHYLKWRTTLYTAVCQCYFDCRADVHGEVFARRALSKISELSQLEDMSDSSFNEGAKKAFKESTLKMAVMIFKRAVFESRRKPKGLLRPKLKNNLKDVEKLPWPRTNTERLLVEMFGNNAAQFLAIVEALTDSNRRVLQAGPPVPDEPEIHDVIAELFFAGIDILSGGGIKPDRGTHGNTHSELSKLIKDCLLLELAVDEKDAVSAEAVVKFSKLAFSYEHWDVFDAVISPLYEFLQAQEDKKWKKEEMDLRILLAAEPLLSGKKHSHSSLVRNDQKCRLDIPDYLQLIGLQEDMQDRRDMEDTGLDRDVRLQSVSNTMEDMQDRRDMEDTGWDRDVQMQSVSNTMEDMRTEEQVSTLKLNEYKDDSHFEELNTKLKSVVEKENTRIKNIKENKFFRDVEDYKRGDIFNLGGQKYGTRRGKGRRVGWGNTSEESGAESSGKESDKSGKSGILKKPRQNRRRKQRRRNNNRNNDDDLQGLSFCPKQSGYTNNHTEAIDIDDMDLSNLLQNIESEPAPVLHTNLRPKSNFMPALSSNKYTSMFMDLVAEDLKLINWKKKGSDNLGIGEREALRDLQENVKIEIKRSDKGGNVVIMSREYYEREVRRLLNDRATYERIRVNPFKNLVDKINDKIIWGYLDGILVEKEMKYLKVDIYTIPTFYILPKTHKNLRNPPGRPIVSGNNGPLEKIAQYVDLKIKDMVQKLPSFVMDTKAVLAEIEGVHVEETWILDVRPDRDIVIDVILFLWQKCKTAVQKMQGGGADGYRFLQKCEINSKWIFILCLIYEAMKHCNIMDTDAVIMGEAALRLAGIAESLADTSIKSGRKTDRSHEKMKTNLSHSLNKSSYMKKNPVTPLIFAYETLDKALKRMSMSCSQGSGINEQSVVDQYIAMLGVKRQHENNTADEQSCSSKSFVNNVTMMDLQLELIVAQHRVSVKILNQLQVDGEQLRSSKPSSQNQRNTETINFCSESEIVNIINKNNLSKAIFLMQKAVLFRMGQHTSPNKLLEDAEKLIQQTEAEEYAVYSSCIKPQESQSGKVSSPPAPILVGRTENSMVFKPAPFKTKNKVAWYCIFGRSVTGPNVKVRLNDHHLPGTGEEVPASESNLLEVRGLKQNEKYVFAVAAYAADGHLIGDVIGESTKPILASSPLSVPATWAYLAQSAYHVGNYEVAKKACSVLWSYFLSPVPVSADPSVSEDIEDYVCQRRLCNNAISKASPILLQLFLGSIFTWSDINMKEGALFCDSVSEGGILQKKQICRIAECERLLVALDVSSLLNDANYALQAVVQCYGLIAPVIYHKIPSVPVVQILIKCLAVLQEIPSSTWQRKQAGVTEGVLHMTACIVYYVAKVLRSWEEYEVAISVIEIGKKLLDMTENTSGNVNIHQSKTSGSEDLEKRKDSEEKEKVSVGKKYLKKKPVIAERVNEQLAALEHKLLKFTKPTAGIELTGQEDPILLHSVVTCWAPNTAFKEIMKFKKKSRFLEFFVQLLQRVLSEEKYPKVIEWSATVFDYLKRRNENVFGSKQTDEVDDVPVPNDSFRRYTTALVEYHKEQASSTVKQKSKQDVPKKVETTKKLPKKKRQNLDPQKLSREELEKKAFTALTTLLTPIVGRYIKRKRLIQASIEEMPWRAQMNLILAQTHFSLFKKKLSQLCGEEMACVQRNSSYRVLDPELFTLHHAGTVVMATETKPGDEQEPSPGHLHPSLKLDLPPDAKLTDSADYSEPSTKRSDADTPRTQMTNDTDFSAPSEKEQEKLNISSVILLEHLGKVFDHLKKAVVLAHRGGQWTLLQNVCRVLWNLVIELQMFAKGIDATGGSFPITKDVLRSEIWIPFYVAADSILDMIFKLQNTGSLKVVDEDETFSVPSCMGGIADEEGGSNLTFEYPFDDVTVVDMRWTCDLVLKTIELLYHVKRWETLIHVAIQFNILTHERFTEQVTPLLANAQRMVADRMWKLKGSNDSAGNRQLHNSDGKMHCRNYIGMQLDVGTVSNKMRDLRDNIDHRGHIVHSGGQRLKTLSCVPLDVMDTFACFRDSLQKSKYSSRALKHSRKLLTLFLAYGEELAALGRQNSVHNSYGKVDFSAGALQAHQSVPPDLSEEEFLSVYSIENKPIPPSHLSLVIASYDKTIEILHSDKQQGLKAQALHELGNLHLYARNKRAAFRCWCQALDETLNMSDALNSWQELDSSPDRISSGRSKDYSERFLSRAGIWGCLLAAVIASKMSRYILTSNIRKRTECCLLSALLFKSLFYVSLPHPHEDLDYASYEIGEGCEVSELIPGIDLFSDRHRADVNVVVSSLGFLISELHSVSQDLVVLPLLTLYQFFVSSICRDPVRCVEGRLLKVRALTDLHLFAEAFCELSLLNNGKRIPRRPHEGFCPAGKPLPSVKFSSSKIFLCSENLQAIEEILNRKPSACLLSVCDQTTVNRLVLAKAHFILKLSSAINAIPEAVKKSSYYVTGENTEHQDVTGSKDKRVGQVQLASKQDLTLPKLKDILLNEAETRTMSVLQDIEMKCQNQFSECSAVDLEIAIEAKLYLCETARQRQHTAVSVAMALSALKIIQEAKIFTVKAQPQSEGPSPSLYCSSPRTEQTGVEVGAQPCESEARERLNMHTWLRCRLALASSLLHQMPGIAAHDQDMLNGSALITEGIVESETLSDDETQAQFLLLAAILDIQEAKPKQGVQLLVQNIIHLLQEKRFISPVARLTLAQSLILSADLMENNEDQQLFWSKQLNTLTSVHKLINKQLICLGEMSNHDITNPSQPPIRNNYLPLISLLAKVKLKIGQILNLQACSIPESSCNVSQLLPSLNLYNAALQLCRTSSFREYDMEAELLFLKGRTQHLLLLLGDHEKSSAIKSFSEAINLSINYDHNFSLMRKSYLEIALIYLHMSSMDTDKMNTTSSRTLKSLKSPITKAKADNVVEKDVSEKTLSQLEIYRLLAWIAVRAATQVGEAMLAYKQLIGERNVAVQTISATVHQHIPSFACMDLLATHKEYLPDGQNITGKQEEAAGSPTVGNLYNLPIAELSWVHVIRYHNHLMRMKNLFTLTGFSDKNDEKTSGNKLYTSVFDNGVARRSAEMHLFLKKYLHSYLACCATDFPAELHWGLEQNISAFHIPSKASSGSTELRQKTSVPVKMSSKMSPGGKTVGEQMATNALDSELCIQWYTPSLERLQHREHMVLFMYAYNKQGINIRDLKKCDPAELVCDYFWIPLPRVLSLHGKLCALRQKAELSLQPVTDVSVPGSGEKQKRPVYTAREKPDMKPVQITEELQTMVQECCSDVRGLFSSAPDSHSTLQASFDITLLSLIRLERVFDLTHGCMLMKGSLLDWMVSQFT
ncbi:cilia- and flagella-associated protein 54 [Hyperolius riggenbachi]|uniref:cilia- and flagella-associated protein 54 n=1 Tax=Hyperolius riggenbachi TaxID=752182 RepID=UPI0035A35B92